MVPPRLPTNAAARLVVSAFLLLTLAAFLGACGDDSSELESENAALRTQVAQVTQTPQLIPTVDASGFCQAVGDFRLRRDALITRFNQLNATDQYFGSFTERETQEILDLETASRSVSIPLPPAGSGEGFLRMNVLVLALKAADERFVAAIRTNDYAAHQAARDESNEAGEELHQLYDSLCDRAR